MKRGWRGMTELARVFEVLEKAGFEVLPVPGMRWLELRKAGTPRICMKEKTLRELVGALGEDPELVARCLTDPMMVRLLKEEAKALEA